MRLARLTSLDQLQLVVVCYYGNISVTLNMHSVKYSKYCLDQLQQY